MPRAEDALTAAMRHAMDAALRGHRGANPLVGAVVMDQSGSLIATGHHRGAGTAHAERDALQNATAAGFSAFETATLLTTLEPCTHQGRQPACTELILRSGIQRVVTAATDPSANGGGAALLAQHGLEVTEGVLEDESLEMNRRWNTSQQQRRPFVTVHLAQTLDARIAAEDGSSQWITSAASRRHTHRIRQRVDAIMVGTNTVAVDDPRLTARTPMGDLAESQPLRVVLGLSNTSPDAALTQGSPEGQGWQQLRTRDPLKALQSLQKSTHAGHPVRHVLVEGGQNVLSAFFAADLVDEVFAYIAPTLLGSGRSALGGIGVHTLAEALRFSADPTDGGAVQTMEDDVLLHLTPVDRSAPGADQSAQSADSAPSLFTRPSPAVPTQPTSARFQEETTCSPA